MSLMSTSVPAKPYQPGKFGGDGPPAAPDAQEGDSVAPENHGHEILVVM